LNIANQEVAIGDGSGASYSVSSSIFESTAELSTSATSSFGLDGQTESSSFGWEFSGNTAYQQVAESMMTTASMNYFGVASVKLSLFTSTINPSTMTSSAAFKTAQQSLPTAVNSDTIGQFINFFNQFGTHFVKSVEFGGSMLVSTMIQSSAVTSAKMTSADLNSGMSATFASLIKLSSSWSTASSTQNSQSFSQFAYSTSAHVLGGDETLRDADAWIRTVSSNPKVISTSLAFIGVLLPFSQQTVVQQAYKQLQSRCPMDSKQNTCSLRGTCDWQTSTCHCFTGFTGKDCSSYACSQKCNNGHCDSTTGLCVCNANWGGCNCDQQCGTIRVDYPSLNGYYIDHCDESGSTNCGKNPANCFCQKKFPNSFASDFHTNNNDDFDYAYRPCSGSMCESGFFSTCNVLASVTCSYSNSDCAVLSQKCTPNKISLKPWNETSDKLHHSI
jgi:hypothetical protein